MLLKKICAHFANIIINNPLLYDLDDPNKPLYITIIKLHMYTSIIRTYKS